MNKYSFLYGVGVGLILASAVFFLSIQYNENFGVEVSNEEEVIEDELEENTTDKINEDNTEKLNEEPEDVLNNN